MTWGHSHVTCNVVSSYFPCQLREQSHLFEETTYNCIKFHGGISMINDACTHMHMVNLVYNIFL